MKKLDKVDKKIIQILQKNARTPLKEIAAQVFLSSPSVSARIEKLEHEGVIIGYTARVNPQYLNYHIKAFITIIIPVFYICGTAGSAGCDGGEVEAGCIPYRIWRIIRSLK